MRSRPNVLTPYCDLLSNSETAMQVSEEQTIIAASRLCGNDLFRDVVC